MSVKLQEANIRSGHSGVSDCVYHRVSPDSRHRQVHLDVRGLSVDYHWLHEHSSADVPVAAVSIHVIKLVTKKFQSSI